MCTQRKMSSTTPSVLLLVLNSLPLASAQSDWDNLPDFEKIFNHVTDARNSMKDQSWQLSNGQIFVILITFFIVVFLVILCCAAGRKRKPRDTSSSPSFSPPIPHQPPSLCHSCQSTIHSVSQLPVSEDPYPPTYDSIYSTTQSRAMFLQHDQNRHTGPAPSAPPISHFT